MRHILFTAFFGVQAILLSQEGVWAGDVTFRVIDEKAKAVENAVISLQPLFDTSYEQGTIEKPEMRQQGVLFAPFVLPVRKDATVSFPNLDEFRHHVYSFSKAKRFELRLYGQDESKQITFDQAGAVALGCNIHDNMLAYIYVTERPIFGKSAVDGTLQLMGLPAGDYEVYVWHPDLKGNSEESMQKVSVSDASSKTNLTLKLRNLRKKQRPPAEDTYN